MINTLAAPLDRNSVVTSINGANTAPVAKKDFLKINSLEFSSDLLTLDVKDTKPNGSIKIELFDANGQPVCSPLVFTAEERKAKGDVFRITGDNTLKIRVSYLENNKLVQQEEAYQAMASWSENGASSNLVLSFANCPIGTRFQVFIKAADGSELYTQELTMDSMKALSNGLKLQGISSDDYIQVRMLDDNGEVDREYVINNPKKPGVAIGSAVQDTSQRTSLGLNRTAKVEEYAEIGMPEKLFFSTNNVSVQNQELLHGIGSGKYCCRVIRHGNRNYVKLSTINSSLPAVFSKSDFNSAIPADKLDAFFDSLKQQDFCTVLQDGSVLMNYYQSQETTSQINQWLNDNFKSLGEGSINEVINLFAQVYVFELGNTASSNKLPPAFETVVLSLLNQMPSNQNTFVFIPELYNAFMDYIATSSNSKKPEIANSNKKWQNTDNAKALWLIRKYIESLPLGSESNASVITERLYKMFNGSLAYIKSGDNLYRSEALVSAKNDNAENIRVSTALEQGSFGGLTVQADAIDEQMLTGFLNYLRKELGLSELTITQAQNFLFDANGPVDGRTWLGSQMYKRADALQVKGISSVIDLIKTLDSGVGYFLDYSPVFRFLRLSQSNEMQAFINVNNIDAKALETEIVKLMDSGDKLDSSNLSKYPVIKSLCEKLLPEFGLNIGLEGNYTDELIVYLLSGTKTDSICLEDLTRLVDTYSKAKSAEKLLTAPLVIQNLMKIAENEFPGNKQSQLKAINGYLAVSAGLKEFKKENTDSSKVDPTIYLIDELVELRSYKGLESEVDNQRRANRDKSGELLKSVQISGFTNVGDFVSWLKGIINIQGVQEVSSIYISMQLMYILGWKNNEEAKTAIIKAIAGVPGLSNIKAEDIIFSEEETRADVTNIKGHFVSIYHKKVDSNYLTSMTQYKLDQESMIYFEETNELEILSGGRMLAIKGIDYATLISIWEELEQEAIIVNGSVVEGWQAKFDSVSHKIFLKYKDKISISESEFIDGAKRVINKKVAVQDLKAGKLANANGDITRPEVIASLMSLTLNNVSAVGTKVVDTENALLNELYARVLDLKQKADKSGGTLETILLSEDRTWLDLVAYEVYKKLPSISLSTVTNASEQQKIKDGVNSVLDDAMSNMNKLIQYALSNPDKVQFKPDHVFLTGEFVDDKGNSLDAEFSTKYGSIALSFARRAVSEFYRMQSSKFSNGLENIALKGNPQFDLLTGERALRSVSLTLKTYLYQTEIDRIYGMASKGEIAADNLTELKDNIFGGRIDKGFIQRLQQAFSNDAEISEFLQKNFLAEDMNLNIGFDELVDPENMLSDENQKYGIEKLQRLRDIVAMLYQQVTEKNKVDLAFGLYTVAFLQEQLGIQSVPSVPSSKNTKVEIKSKELLAAVISIVNGTTNATNNALFEQIKNRGLLKDLLFKMPSLNTYLNDFSEGRAVLEAIEGKDNDAYLSALKAVLEKAQKEGFDLSSTASADTRVNFFVSQFIQAIVSSNKFQESMENNSATMIFRFEAGIPYDKQIYGKDIREAFEYFQKEMSTDEEFAVAWSQVFESKDIDVINKLPADLQISSLDQDGGLSVDARKALDSMKALLIMVRNKRMGNFLSTKHFSVNAVIEELADMDQAIVASSKETFNTSEERESFLKEKLEELEQSETEGLQLIDTNVSLGRFSLNKLLTTNSDASKVSYDSDFYTKLLQTFSPGVSINAHQENPSVWEYPIIGLADFFSSTWELIKSPFTKLAPWVYDKATISGIEQRALEVVGSSSMPESVLDFFRLYLNDTIERTQNGADDPARLAGSIYSLLSLGATILFVISKGMNKIVFNGYEHVYDKSRGFVKGKEVDFNDVQAGKYQGYLFLPNGEELVNNRRALESFTKRTLKQLQLQTGERILLTENPSLCVMRDRHPKEFRKLALERGKLVLYAEFMYEKSFETGFSANIPFQQPRSRQDVRGTLSRFHEGVATRAMDRDYKDTEVGRKSAAPDSPKTRFMMQVSSSIRKYMTSLGIMTPEEKKNVLKHKQEFSAIETSKIPVVNETDGNKRSNLITHLTESGFITDGKLRLTEPANIKQVVDWMKNNGYTPKERKPIERFLDSTKTQTLWEHLRRITNHYSNSDNKWVSAPSEVLNRAFSFATWSMFLPFASQGSTFHVETKTAVGAQVYQRNQGGYEVGTAPYAVYDIKAKGVEYNQGTASYMKGGLSYDRIKIGDNLYQYTSVDGEHSQIKKGLGLPSGFLEVNKEKAQLAYDVIDDLANDFSGSHMERTNAGDYLVKVGNKNYRVSSITVEPYLQGAKPLGFFVSNPDAFNGLIQKYSDSFKIQTLSDGQNALIFTRPFMLMSERNEFLKEVTDDKDIILKLYKRGIDNNVSLRRVGAGTVRPEYRVVLNAGEHGLSEKVVIRELFLPENLAVAIKEANKSTGATAEFLNKAFDALKPKPAETTNIAEPESGKTIVADRAGKPAVEGAMDVAPSRTVEVDASRGSASEAIEKTEIQKFTDFCESFKQVLISSQGADDGWSLSEQQINSIVNKLKALGEAIESGQKDFDTARRDAVASMWNTVLLERHGDLRLSSDQLAFKGLQALSVPNSKIFIKSNKLYLHVNRADLNEHCGLDLPKGKLAGRVLLELTPNDKGGIESIRVLECNDNGKVKIKDSNPIIVQDISGLKVKRYLDSIVLESHFMTLAKYDKTPGQLDLSDTIKFNEEDIETTRTSLEKLFSEKLDAVRMQQVQTRSKEVDRYETEVVRLTLAQLKEKHVEYDQALTAKFELLLIAKRNRNKPDIDRLNIEIADLQNKALALFREGVRRSTSPVDIADGGFENLFSKVAKEKIAKLTANGKELSIKTNEGTEIKVTDFNSLVNALNENKLTVQNVSDALFSVGLELKKQFQGKRMFREQIYASVALLNKMLAELPCGAGKTIVGGASGYVFSLFGKGVHVTSAIDDLALKDFAEIRGYTYYITGDPNYVGCVSGLPDQRGSSERATASRQAYSSRMTYGTVTDMVFDLLSDVTSENIDTAKLITQGLWFHLADEVDQSLIVQALSDRIMSGKVAKVTFNEKSYLGAYLFTYNLQKEGDRAGRLLEGNRNTHEVLLNVHEIRQELYKMISDYDAHIESAKGEDQAKLKQELSWLKSFRDDMLKRNETLAVRQIDRSLDAYFHNDESNKNWSIQEIPVAGRKNDGKTKQLVLNSAAEGTQQIGSKFSEGLQQALEAQALIRFSKKLNIDVSSFQITEETETSGRIKTAIFAQMYYTFVGMSGTLTNESRELERSIGSAVLSFADPVKPRIIQENGAVYRTADHLQMDLAERIKESSPTDGRERANPIIIAENDYYKQQSIAKRLWLQELERVTGVTITSETPLAKAMGISEQKGVICFKKEMSFERFQKEYWIQTLGLQDSPEMQEFLKIDGTKDGRVYDANRFLKEAWVELYSKGGNAVPDTLRDMVKNDKIGISSFIKGISELEGLGQSGVIKPNNSFMTDGSIRKELLVRVNVLTSQNSTDATERLRLEGGRYGSITIINNRGGRGLDWQLTEIKMHNKIFELISEKESLTNVEFSELLTTYKNGLSKDIGKYDGEIDKARDNIWKLFKTNGIVADTEVSFTLTIEGKEVVVTRDSELDVLRKANGQLQSRIQPLAQTELGNNFAKLEEAQNEKRETVYLQDAVMEFERSVKSSESDILPVLRRNIDGLDPSIEYTRARISLVMAIKGSIITTLNGQTVTFKGVEGVENLLKMIQAGTTPDAVQEFDRITTLTEADKASLKTANADKLSEMQSRFDNLIKDAQGEVRGGSYFSKLLMEGRGSDLAVAAVEPMNGFTLYTTNPSLAGRSVDTQSKRRVGRSGARAMVISLISLDSDLTDRLGEAYTQKGQPNTIGRMLGEIGDLYESNWTKIGPEDPLNRRVRVMINGCSLVSENQARQNRSSNSEVDRITAEYFKWNNEASTLLEQVAKRVKPLQQENKYDSLRQVDSEISKQATKLLTDFHALQIKKIVDISEGMKVSELNSQIATLAKMYRITEAEIVTNFQEKLADKGYNGDLAEFLKGQPNSEILFKGMTINVEQIKIDLIDSLITKLDASGVIKATAGDMNLLRIYELLKGVNSSLYAIRFNTDIKEGLERIYKIHDANDAQKLAQQLLSNELQSLYKYMRVTIATTAEVSSGDNLASTSSDYFIKNGLRGVRLVKSKGELVLELDIVRFKTEDNYVDLTGKMRGSSVEAYLREVCNKEGLTIPEGKSPLEVIQFRFGQDATFNISSDDVSKIKAHQTQMDALYGRFDKLIAMAIISIEPTAGAKIVIPFGDTTVEVAIGEKEVMITSSQLKVSQRLPRTEFDSIRSDISGVDAFFKELAAKNNLSADDISHRIALMDALLAVSSSPSLAGEVSVQITEDGPTETKSYSEFEKRAGKVEIELVDGTKLLVRIPVFKVLSLVYGQGNTSITEADIRNLLTTEEMKIFEAAKIEHGDDLAKIKSYLETQHRVEAKLNQEIMDYEAKMQVRQRSLFPDSFVELLKTGIPALEPFKFDIGTSLSDQARSILSEYSRNILNNIEILSSDRFKNNSNIFDGLNKELAELNKIVQDQSTDASSVKTLIDSINKQIQAFMQGEHKDSLRISVDTSEVLLKKAQTADTLRADIEMLQKLKDSNGQLDISNLKTNDETFKKSLEGKTVDEAMRIATAKLADLIKEFNAMPEFMYSLRATHQRNQFIWSKYLANLDSAVKSGRLSIEKRAQLLMRAEGSVKPDAGKKLVDVGEECWRNAKYYGVFEYGLNQSFTGSFKDSGVRQGLLDTGIGAGSHAAKGFAMGTVAGMILNMGKLLNDENYDAQQYVHDFYEQGLHFAVFETEMFTLKMLGMTGATPQMVTWGQRVATGADALTARIQNTWFKRTVDTMKPAVASKTAESIFGSWKGMVTGPMAVIFGTEMAIQSKKLRASGNAGMILPADLGTIVNLSVFGGSQAVVDHAIFRLAAGNQGAGSLFGKGLQRFHMVGLLAGIVLSGMTSEQLNKWTPVKTLGIRGDNWYRADGGLHFSPYTFTTDVLDHGMPSLMSATFRDTVFKAGADGKLVNFSRWATGGSPVATSASLSSKALSSLKGVPFVIVYAGTTSVVANYDDLVGNNGAVRWQAMRDVSYDVLDAGIMYGSFQLAGAGFAAGSAVAGPVGGVVVGGVIIVGGWALTRVDKALTDMNKDQKATIEDALKGAYGDRFKFTVRDLHDGTSDEYGKKDYRGSMQERFNDRIMDIFMDEHFTLNQVAGLDKYPDLLKYIEQQFPGKNITNISLRNIFQRLNIQEISVPSSFVFTPDMLLSCMNSAASDRLSNKTGPLTITVSGLEKESLRFARTGIVSSFNINTNFTGPVSHLVSVGDYFTNDVNYLQIEQGKLLSTDEAGNTVAKDFIELAELSDILFDKDQSKPRPLFFQMVNALRDFGMLDRLKEMYKKTGKSDLADMIDEITKLLDKGENISSLESFSAVFWGQKDWFDKLSRIIYDATNISTSFALSSKMDSKNIQDDKLTRQALITQVLGLKITDDTNSNEARVLYARLQTIFIRLYQLGFINKDQTVGNSINLWNTSEVISILTSDKTLGLNTQSAERLLGLLQMVQVSGSMAKQNPDKHPLHVSELWRVLQMHQLIDEKQLKANFSGSADRTQVFKECASRLISKDIAHSVADSFRIPSASNPNIPEIYILVQKLVKDNKQVTIADFLTEFSRSFSDTNTPQMQNLLSIIKRLSEGKSFAESLSLLGIVDDGESKEAVIQSLLDLLWFSFSRLVNEKSGAEKMFLNTFSLVLSDKAIKSIFESHDLYRNLLNSISSALEGLPDKDLLAFLILDAGLSGGIDKDTVSLLFKSNLTEEEKAKVGGFKKDKSEVLSIIKSRLNSDKLQDTYRDMLVELYRKINGGISKEEFKGLKPYEIKPVINMYNPFVVSDTPASGLKKVNISTIESTRCSRFDWLVLMLHKGNIDLEKISNKDLAISLHNCDYSHFSLIEKELIDGETNDKKLNKNTKLKDWLSLQTELIDNFQSKITGSLPDSPITINSECYLFEGNIYTPAELMMNAFKISLGDTSKLVLVSELGPDGKHDTLQDVFKDDKNKDYVLNPIAQDIWSNPLSYLDGKGKYLGLFNHYLALKEYKPNDTAKIEAHILSNNFKEEFKKFVLENSTSFDAWISLYVLGVIVIESKELNSKFQEFSSDFDLEKYIKDNRVTAFGTVSNFTPQTLHGLIDRYDNSSENSYKDYIFPDASADPAQQRQKIYDKYKEQFIDKGLNKNNTKEAVAKLGFILYQLENNVKITPTDISFIESSYTFFSNLPLNFVEGLTSNDVVERPEMMSILFRTAKFLPDAKKAELIRSFNYHVLGDGWGISEDKIVRENMINLVYELFNTMKEPKLISDLIYELTLSIEGETYARGADDVLRNRFTRADSSDSLRGKFKQEIRGSLGVAYFNSLQHLMQDKLVNSTSKDEYIRFLDIISVGIKHFNEDLSKNSLVILSELLKIAKKNNVDIGSELFNRVRSNVYGDMAWLSHNRREAQIQTVVAPIYRMLYQDGNLSDKQKTQIYEMLMAPLTGYSEWAEGLLGFSQVAGASSMMEDSSSLALADAIWGTNHYDQQRKMAEDILATPVPVKSNDPEVRKEYLTNILQLIKDDARFASLVLKNSFSTNELLSYYDKDTTILQEKFLIRGIFIALFNFQLKENSADFNKTFNQILFSNNEPTFYAYCLTKLLFDIGAFYDVKEDGTQSFIWGLHRNLNTNQSFDDFKDMFSGDWWNFSVDISDGKLTNTQKIQEYKTFIMYRMANFIKMRNNNQGKFYFDLQFPLTEKKYADSYQVWRTAYLQANPQLSTASNLNEIIPLSPKFYDDIQSKQAKGDFEQYLVRNHSKKASRIGFSPELIADLSLSASINRDRKTTDIKADNVVMKMAIFVYYNQNGLGKGFDQEIREAQLEFIKSLRDVKQSATIYNQLDFSIEIKDILDLIRDYSNTYTWESLTEEDLNYLVERLNIIMPQIVETALNRKNE